MNAIADLSALVRACPVDWLDAKYGAAAEPGDIADQLYAAVRAEVLPEEADRLRTERGRHASRAIFMDGITHSADLLDQWAADGPREKSSREATATDTNRRARLLHEIALGGRWKSGGVVRWYRVNGFPNLGVRAARFDLATLRDSGALVQHEEKGVRYFTAPRGGGHR